jgi:hypothetical protein
MTEQNESKSQNSRDEQSALGGEQIRDLVRQAIASAKQAGISHLWIYPAVTDPSIKPISDLGYG